MDAMHDEYEYGEVDEEEKRRGEEEEELGEMVMGCLKREGRAMTAREIAGRLGLYSITEAVTACLRALERAGHVDAGEDGDEWTVRLGSAW